MKVTGLKTFLVTPSAKRAGVVGGKNWLFVKVETDEGIEGWGEAYTQLDRDRAIEEHVRELGRYLVGRDPFAIKHFSAIVYDDFSSRRGSMDLYCALSGIEQALWDVVGKKLGAPAPSAWGAVPRPHPRVRQRLVRRLVAPRRVRREGRRDGGPGIQRDEVRPVPQAVAVLRRQGGRAVGHRRRPRRAGGGRPGRRPADRGAPPPVSDERDPLRQGAGAVQAVLVRGAGPRRERARAGRGARADARPDRDRRDPLHQGRVQGGVRAPRRRHHQPGRVQLRRHPGAEGDRRDGGAVLRRRIAAQLQQHDHRAGRDGPRRPRACRTS